MFDIIHRIIQELLRFVPYFRIGWIISTLIGFVMVIIALILRKNPLYKKSPWIVGIGGALLSMCSGTQLILSFFRF